MSHDLEKQQFYKQYSNKFNKIKYKAEKFFYVDLFRKCFIHNNPRKIWSTINSLLHTKSIIHQLLLNCVLMILS